MFDLSAADAHYHKKCMYLFIRNRSGPNHQTVVLATDYIDNTPNIPFMQKIASVGSNGSTIWVSISYMIDWLYWDYGQPVSHAQLLKAVSGHYGNQIVVLPCPE